MHLVVTVFRGSYYDPCSSNRRTLAGFLYRSISTTLKPYIIPEAAHFVQQASQCPHVRALIVGARADLLRRHVVRGAAECTCEISRLCVVSFPQDSRQACRRYVLIPLLFEDCAALLDITARSHFQKSINRADNYFLRNPGNIQEMKA